MNNDNCNCEKNCDCESENIKLSEMDENLYLAAEAIMFASEKLKNLNSMMSLTLVSMADILLQHTDYMSKQNNQNNQEPVIDEKIKKEVDELYEEIISNNEDLLE